MHAPTDLTDRHDMTHSLTARLTDTDRQTNKHKYLTGCFCAMQGWSTSHSIPGEGALHLGYGLCYWGARSSIGMPARAGPCPNPVHSV